MIASSCNTNNPKGLQAKKPSGSAKGADKRRAVLCVLYLNCLLALKSDSLQRKNDKGHDLSHELPFQKVDLISIFSTKLE